MLLANANECFISCQFSWLSLFLSVKEGRARLKKTRSVFCLCVCADCAATSLGEDQGKACRKHPRTVGDEQDRAGLDLRCSEYQTAPYCSWNTDHKLPLDTLLFTYIWKSNMLVSCLSYIKVTTSILVGRTCDRTHVWPECHQNNVD